MVKETKQKEIRVGMVADDDNEEESQRGTNKVHNDINEDVVMK